MTYRPSSPPNGGGAALAARGSNTASSMREVLFLLGDDGAILWSDASHSAVHLPDSRARWEAIWSLRGRIVEVAHSHPLGPLAFSHEDETTMRALVTSLGRPLLFSIVAPSGMLRRLVREEPAASGRSTGSLVEEEPWWTSLLRLASGIAAGERASAPLTTRGGSILLETKEK